MFKCDVCNKEFASLSKLNRHKNKKIPCTRNKFECYKCNKIFSCQQSLSRHRKKCKEEYVQRESTNTINIEIIPSQCVSTKKIIKCNYCDKVFTTRQAKSVHMNRHCKFKDRKYEEDREKGYYHNIKLREYGNENMEWLGDINNLREASIKIGECETPTDLLRVCFQMMHANQKAIENRNVRVRSKRDFYNNSLLEVYKNQQWYSANANVVVEESVRKLMDNTTSMLHRNQHLLTSGESINYKNSIDILEEDENESKNKLRDLMLSVIDVLFNNK